MQFPYSPLEEDDYSHLDRGGKEKTRVSYFSYQGCLREILKHQQLALITFLFINIKHLSIQYIGCIKVNVPMCKLNQPQRAEVAKESIIRLCEANNIRRTTDRKRQEDLNSWLQDEPTLSHSGTDVHLRVTKTHLQIVSKETNQTIIQHEMPNVSFASSGDEKDTKGFIAYVAKDATLGRACFVLECGHDTAMNVLEDIARCFRIRTEQIQSNLHNTGTLSNSKGNNINHFCNTMHLTDLHDSSLEPSYRINNENQDYESVVAITRSSLEEEPWFHGSHLSREESEKRLKQNGDFLVRESMLDPGQFVLSVMHDGTKLHLLFDSMGKVRTKDLEFDNVSSLVKHYHDEGLPIIADNRSVYLRNGVRPNSRN